MNSTHDRMPHRQRIAWTAALLVPLLLLVSEAPAFVPNQGQNPTPPEVFAQAIGLGFFTCSMPIETAESARDLYYCRPDFQDFLESLDASDLDFSCRQIERTCRQEAQVRRSCQNPSINSEARILRLITDNPAAIGSINTIQGECRTAQRRQTVDEKVVDEPANPATADAVSCRALREQCLQLSLLDCPSNFINRTFERGVFSPWDTATAGVGLVEIDDGRIDPPGPSTPQEPLQGNFSVLFSQTDGNLPALARVSQDVTIADQVRTFVAGESITLTVVGATLNWEDTVENFGVFGPNQAWRVQVREPSDDSLIETLFSIPPSGIGAPRTADLTAYIGQGIRIVFEMESSNGFLTIRLDDTDITLETLEP